MAVEDSLEMVTLPGSTLERVPQTVVRDAVQYFTPDLVAIPGPRTAKAHASVREAAPDIRIIVSLFRIDCPTAGGRTGKSLQ